MDKQKKYHSIMGLRISILGFRLSSGRVSAAAAAAAAQLHSGTQVCNQSAPFCLAAVQAKKQYVCSICTRLKRGGEDDAIALTYPIGLCKEKMQKELGISTVYK